MVTGRDLQGGTCGERPAGRDLRGETCRERPAWRDLQGEACRERAQGAAGRRAPYLGFTSD